MNNPLTVLSVALLGLGLEIQYEKDAAGHVLSLEITWIIGSYKKLWST